MAFWQHIERFAANDMRLIRRDSFMLTMAMAVFVIGLAARFLLPWADTYLADTGVLPSSSSSIRLSELYPMMVSFLGLFQTAVLVGAIFGFLFLDEKDGNTLKAFQVSPIAMHRYLTYRAAMPALLCFAVMLVTLQLMGNWHMALWKMWIIAFAAAPAGALMVLYFALCAQNKIQGFAMGKFVALAGWLIPVAWFVPGPWQWLFSVFPPFLVHKAFWMAEEGESSWWVFAGLGFVLQTLIAALLIRWVPRVI